MLRLSRAQLHDLVWSKPMTTIANELGVRDQHIAQACDEYDIARPPAGHWQKIKHGKEVRTAALSNARLGADDVLIVGKGTSGEVVCEADRASGSSVDQLFAYDSGDPAADKLKAFLDQNGLADTIAVLKLKTAADCLVLNCDDTLSKMTLILRVLGLPPGSADKLLERLEELTTE